ncbi:hypothetical protein SISSUDRAFT_1049483 [Sistotremastrum suecicum HHB10207 ss-3]|uniref:Transmembrane protein n=1 Tax=Sistotremastrum suecicum HHB10207 ss-3 TaxID=1314776 RepID=A0A166BTZ2_9AGAM|nr:hypothetical protein SISSUDRAFT_1049483 [Sistotremastrum suecicum HHB10207 ss-3]
MHMRKSTKSPVSFGKPVRRTALHINTMREDHRSVTISFRRAVDFPLNFLILVSILTTSDLAIALRIGV